MSDAKDRARRRYEELMAERRRADQQEAATTDEPYVVECPECFALVRAERLAAHEYWHDLKWPRSES